MFGLLSEKYSFAAWVSGTDPGQFMGVCGNSLAPKHATRARISWPGRLFWS